MLKACYFLLMPRHASPVNLTETDRLELERWVAAHRTPQQVSQRCQIVLAAAQGQQDNAIAAELEINFKTVALWRKRFHTEGPDCLWEVAEGRGRKARLTAEDIERIVDATLQTKPAGATHWSCRTMARAQGVSKATINRIWQSHHLQPHRTRNFKLSRDPKFLEKLTDVVGLYLNPPEKALVLCVDEKSQIQALDRTQPGLPIKKGRCGTMTHDYKGHGTTHALCGLRSGCGQSGRPVLRPASASGISQVSQTAGWRISRRGQTPSGDGQLRHAQTSPSSGMVETASSFRIPFHSHQFKLVEFGRTLVWRIDGKTGAPGRLCQRGGFDRRHRAIRGGVEQRTKAVRLDRNARLHRGEAQGLPPDAGANQARLHFAKIKENPKITPVVCETLH